MLLPGGYKSVNSEVLRSTVIVLAALLAGLGLAEAMVRVAARSMFEVKYLATAGAVQQLRQFDSLEALIAEHGFHLQPHRVWNNYYANAYGFMDTEFSTHKEPSSVRIMALGDSFAYGMVGYPDNVLTLVEQHLSNNCDRRDIEVMNFGIPATGLWEYRLVHQLAAPIFKPDRVIIHFYMGNDGPDLVTESSRRLSFSYAWTFLRNSVTLLRSVEHGTSAATAPQMPSSAVRGGSKASNAPDLGDEDFQPSFTEATFAGIAAAELRRFYVPPNGAETELWQSTLNLLDLMAGEVLSTTGKRPIVVLYPSALQLDAQLFETAKRSLQEQVPGVRAGAFDLHRPSRILLEHCRSRGLACHDLTPGMRSAAAHGLDALYRPRDTHWNVRGNRIAAATESRFLTQEICPSP